LDARPGPCGRPARRRRRRRLAGRAGRRGRPGRSPRLRRLAAGRRRLGGPPVKDYDVSTYGDRIADVYDEWYGEARFLETDAAVDFLAELAGDGPVLDPARFAGGRVSVSKIELDLVQLDVTLLDQAEQKSTAQHVVLRPDGIRFYPVNVRWAYPPELDLMAKLAGLELRERFGSWRRDPFTKESGHHVSVYGKA